jgi:MEMO1 family protein
MDLIAKQNYEEFDHYLRVTHNTICGRYSPLLPDLISSHPIGVIMCALERLKESDMNVNGKWDFVKYEQSSHVEQVRDSSVSYVSAYWAPLEHV